MYVCSMLCGWKLTINDIFFKIIYECDKWYFVYLLWICVECVAASKEQIGGLFIEMIHLYNSSILEEIERLQDLIGFLATFKFFLWNFYSLEIIGDGNSFELNGNKNSFQILMQFRTFINLVLTTFYWILCLIQMCTYVYRISSMDEISKVNPQH